ncbi:MAG: extracellular solute-binding protein [Treponema sp.]|jgi:ABC-type glycerol-3-phosphate transport system substrate-binding protein|nr:extracellular solute-binding protein [Treponema sp.]
MKNVFSVCAWLCVFVFMTGMPVVVFAGGSGQSGTQGGTVSPGQYKPDGGPGDYADPASISAEVIKPSFWVISQTGYNGSEIVWQAIKKATNIDFQITPVPLASYNEKLTTTIASQTLPDVMGLRSYSTVDRYGPQGAFLSFEPYIAAGQMPNYLKVLNANPPAMQLATSPDGVRYGAPRIYETPRMDEAFLARIDILEKLRLSREPETLDDFYKLLKTVKDNYPASAPYINRWEVSHLLSGFGNIMNTSYTYYLDPDAGDYVYGPATQNFKDMLAFVARLYKDNLIAKDFGVMSDEEYEEALIKNTGMFSYDYQDTAFYEAGKNLADAGWFWGAILPPKYNGKRYGYPVLQGYYSYTKVISAATKYKNELIRFFDWTYSGRGAKTLMFGTEGETYRMENGAVKMLADIQYAGNPSGSITSHGLNDQFVFSVLTGEGAEFFENVGQFTIAQKKYLTDHNAFAKPVFGARFYDENKQKRYTDIRNPTDTYVLEAATQIILGRASVDSWDKEVQVLKTTFKVDEGLDLIREAYRETFNK